MPETDAGMRTLFHCGMTFVRIGTPTLRTSLARYHCKAAGYGVSTPSVRYRNHSNFNRICRKLESSFLRVLWKFDADL